MAERYPSRSVERRVKLQRQTSNRTYWHVPGARSWHARDHAVGVGWVGFALACGRWISLPRDEGVEQSDRIPPDAHLCGNCARVIAARTDVEK